MEIQGSGYQEEFETAVQAAEAAGEIMDRYRKKGVEVKDTKTGETDIVTQADEDSQKRIVEIIKEKFPGDNFLGEEELREDKGSDRTWIIDPIDGTFNFQKGNEYFCTSIALREDNETKVAVVNSPETGLNEIFYAVKGCNSYLRKYGEHRKLQVSDQDELKGSLILLTMISRNSDERWKSFQEIITEFRDRDVQFRRQGSLVLGGCKTAQGIFDGAIQYGWTWDFAASKLVLEEAGGEQLQREKISDGLDETVKSNGRLQKDLENLLRESKTGGTGT